MKPPFPAWLLPTILLAVLTTQLSSAPPALPGSRQQWEQVRMRFVRAVQPTADQEAQLEQVWRTYLQSLDNWDRQNGPPLEMLQQRRDDAIQTNDADTLRATRRKLQALLATRGALFQSLAHQMEDILDEKQLPQARKVLQSPSHGADVLRAMDQLKLTELQKAEIQAVIDNAARRTGKNAPALRAKAMDDAIETIRQTLLRREQNARLSTILRQQQAQAKRQALLADIEYTDEQKTRIRAILAEARTQAQALDDPKAKRAIREQARRKIRQEVWTDRQREQFHQGWIERHRRHMQAIGMSETQIARAETILAEAHKKAKTVQNGKEKQQIMRKALETIRRTVLTDRQRKTWGER